MVSFLFNFFKPPMAVMAVFFALTACGSKRPQVVNDFSLGRYLGSWYEIARLDNSFEKGCEEVMADYRLRQDGNVSVTNSCILDGGRSKVAKGVAKFATDDISIGALKVSFFRPFYAPYNIRYLSEDYNISIVTGNNKKYLWILSRTPIVPQTTMFLLLKKVEELGFEVSKLHFTKHQGEQAPAPDKKLDEKV